MLFDDYETCEVVFGTCILFALVFKIVTLNHASFSINVKEKLKYSTVYHLQVEQHVLYLELMTNWYTYFGVFCYCLSLSSVQL